MRLGAGVRHRRLHRSRRQPDRLRRAARRLLRGRPAPLRREGRHRLHRGDAPRSRRAAAEAGDGRVAVRRRPTDPARHALDPARTGRPDRLRRVDERRSAAAAALSRTARRQAPGRGRPGAAPVSNGRRSSPAGGRITVPSPRPLPAWRLASIVERSTRATDWVDEAETGVDGSALHETGEGFHWQSVRAEGKNIGLKR